MPTDPSNFNDPALKGAVRQAWGNQRAPDTLRHSVMLAAIASRPVAPKPPKLKWLGKQPLYKLAAAAMITLGVGSLAYQAYRSKHPHHAHVLVVQHLPQAVVQMLEANHDQAAGHPESSPQLPVNSPDKIASAVKSKIPYPPLTAPIGNGFALTSATFGPVGTSQGLHMVYTHGPQTVSVYTLPASAAPTCSADALINGGTPTHPIAGFTHGGAFYAVVGSSSDKSLSSSDVQAIRDSLLGSIPGAGCDSE